MRIVVTGGKGFIGRNLCVRLSELGHRDVRIVGRDASSDALVAALSDADFVFHLAGVNRPEKPAEFERDNAQLTAVVCAALRATGRKTALAFASSTQATLDNVYGRSKLAGEIEVERYGLETKARAFVLRLPNVFGKWSRPNYNSVVATFCHNIARDIPISVSDPAAPLRLVYIDDVVDALVCLLDQIHTHGSFVTLTPTYDTTVGEVAMLLRGFAASRRTLDSGRVGEGLIRALYSTYVSFLPPEAFSYDLVRHDDLRGVFVEMLKTPDCGQFSYFTAPPGVTRGSHYHHSKTEKFLIVAGTARFGFRHLVTNETHSLTVRAAEARVVETIPGWVHDITNVGSEDLVVMLWANERFDTSRPDTFAAKVSV